MHYCFRQAKQWQDLLTNLAAQIRSLRNEIDFRVSRARFSRAKVDSFERATTIFFHSFIKKAANVSAK